VMPTRELSPTIDKPIVKFARPQQR